MSEFTCHKCKRPAPVHVWLDGQLWNEIKPDYSSRSDSGGVLCLYCMSDVLTARGFKDGSVGLSISNGPFCNMKWGSIIDPMNARIAELEAENERLTKAVGSGVLKELLDDDETEEFVKFIKFLRESAKKA